MPPRAAANASGRPRSRLLDLPREIKDIIWGYAMPAEKKITFGHHASHVIRPHHLSNRISDTKRRTRQGFITNNGLNLLLTSRLVYFEAEHILYSGTTFIFESADAVVAFLFAAKAKANLIQSVDIKLSASAQESDYYVNHNRHKDVRGMALAAERFTGLRQLKIQFIVNQYGFQNFTDAKWSNLAELLGHKMVILPLTNLPSLTKVSVTFKGHFEHDLLHRLGSGEPLARGIRGFDGKEAELAKDANKMFTLQQPGQVRQAETGDADGEDPAEWDGKSLTFLGQKWAKGKDGRIIVKIATASYRPNKKPKKGNRSLKPTFLQRNRTAALDWNSGPEDDGDDA